MSFLHTAVLLGWTVYYEIASFHWVFFGCVSSCYLMQISLSVVCLHVIVYIYSVYIYVIVCNVIYIPVYGHLSCTPISAGHIHEKGVYCIHSQLRILDTGQFFSQIFEKQVRTVRRQSVSVVICYYDCAMYG